MSNSLRMIGLSLVAWIGIHIGISNAAILDSAEIQDNLLFSEKENATQGSSLDELRTISSKTNENQAGATFINYDFDQEELNKSLGPMELFVSEDSMLEPESTTDQIALINVDSAVAPDRTALSKEGHVVSDTENKPFLPERGAFAMLLVGIGLVILAARRKRDVI